MNPALQTVGNGFACHHSTGLLYTTSEGNFEPGTGVVYEVDPRTHTAVLILQGLWAADGLWLDQERHLLYVGLLFTSEVIVWDIASRSILRTIPKGIPGLLDDFCLDHSGGAIIGAAWTDDSIVMYAMPFPQCIFVTLCSCTTQRQAAPPCSPAFLSPLLTLCPSLPLAGASSFVLPPHACTHPTSVRWGVADRQQVPPASRVGKNHLVMLSRVLARLILPPAQNSLFVTEGRGVSAGDSSSRLLWVDMQ